MIPDASTAEAVAKRLQTATANLHRMANDVGHARQVKEFIGDMKKNLLAKYVVRSLKAGETSTAAESIGRADSEFQRELGALQSAYEASEQTIAKWQSEQASFEAARSLLSFEKETMHALTE